MRLFDQQIGRYPTKYQTMSPEHAVIWPAHINSEDDSSKF